MKKARISVASLGIAISIVAAAVLASVSVEVVRYPMLSVILGSAVFIAIVYLPSRGESRSWTHSSTKTRSLDIIILLSIAGLAILGPEIAGKGVLPVLILATGTVLAYRIWCGKWRSVPIVVEIALLSIAARSSLYFSAPVYGPDQFHPGIVNYIMESGTLISENIIYYSQYPITHLLAASGGLLTETDHHLAMFLFVGVSQALSFLVVWLVAQHLSGDSRLSALSVLAVSLSAGPMIRGSTLFAQTLSGAFFVFVFWLLIRRDGIRLNALFLAFIPFAFFAHHSIGFSLPILIISYWVAGQVLMRLPPPLDISGAYKVSQLPIYRALAVLGVLVWYYWISIGQTRGQINRIMKILEINRGSGQDTIDQAVLPPAIEVLGVEIPTVLSWAGPILSLVLLVVAAGLLTLFQVLRSGSAEDVTQLRYSIMAIISFAVFAIAYVIGGQDAVIRVLPAFTVVVGLLLVVLGSQLSHRSLGGPVIIGICACLILTGIMTPAVSVPERTDDSFKPSMTDQEVAASQWALSYGNERPIASDQYVASSLIWRSIAAGNETSRDRYLAVLNNANPTETERYWDRPNESLTIWRSQYTNIYSIEQNPNDSVVYSAGNTTVKERADREGS